MDGTLSHQVRQMQVLPVYCYYLKARQCIDECDALFQTLIYGVISCNDDKESIDKMAELLLSLGVPEELFQIETEGIHIAFWILEEIRTEISADAKEMCIIERYPFPGGMVVEKIPL